MTVGGIMMIASLVLTGFVLKKVNDSDVERLLLMLILLFGVTGIVLFAIGVDSAPFPKTPKKKE